VPRYIRWVDELPMTVTGKPQKLVMREAMVRELGLGEGRNQSVSEPVFPMTFSMILPALSSKQ
jgi:hypothetical protein